MFEKQISKVESSKQKRQCPGAASLARRNKVQNRNQSRRLQHRKMRELSSLRWMALG